MCTISYTSRCFHFLLFLIYFNKRNSQAFTSPVNFCIHLSNSHILSQFLVFCQVFFKQNSTFQNHSMEKLLRQLFNLFRLYCSLPQTVQFSLFFDYYISRCNYHSSSHHPKQHQKRTYNFPLKQFTEICTYYKNRTANI